MTPQERQLIAQVFDRLKTIHVDRDPDADRFILTEISTNPAAPYLLTQTVVVQEQALKEAQARIAELERGSTPAVARSGLWGQAAAPAPAPQPANSPWGQQPAGGAWGQQPGQQPMQQPMQQQPQRGGFLRTALGTAAGVAGGMLLFSGLSSMFGGGQANAAPAADAGQNFDSQPTADQSYDAGPVDEGSFDSGEF